MFALHKAAIGIDSIEQLSQGNSFIHCLHPLSKLVTTAVYIVTVVSFSGYEVSSLVSLFLYPIALILLSDIPLGLLLKRVLIVLPFPLIAALSNLFLLSDTAFYIGSFGITFGILSFASIIIKTILTILAVLILTATTPFSLIGSQLAYLRLPKILCLQLIMTYRYLSVLLSEASSMFTAYKLRSPYQRAIQIKDIGVFIGQLILRSFDRAGRVYNAMKCRGFIGISSYKVPIPKAGFSDFIYGITVCSLTLFFRFFNVSYFLGRFIG